MKKLFLSMAVFSLALLFAGELSAKEILRKNVEKKLLQFGWDNPTPAELCKNLALYETYLPYDGVGISLDRNVTRPDGKKTSLSWSFFTKLKFQHEWFKKDLEYLKKVHKNAKKLKYNFIGTSASCFTGEFDIFDDSFWKIVCNNYTVVARLAKQGGCKGIRLDLEDYGNYGNFRYRAECGKSYEEAWNMARKRGRQWMNAIAKEFPDVTIFCFFWLDLMMGYADGSPELHKRLQGCGTGLLVAFINGIYDALPPKAKIVDGMESYGYAANNLQNYQTMRALRELRFPRLLAPENQRKFREQGSFSVATYFSPYTRSSLTKGFRKYMVEGKMTPLEFFRCNFTYAVEHSDEYAWTWNEHRRWIPGRYKHGWQNKALDDSPDVPGPYMGMAIPGVEDAMLYAKDPWKYAHNLLKNPKKLKNLLKNASFEGKGGKAAVALAPDSVVFKKLPNWETWKNKRSKAEFALGVKEGVKGSNAIMIKNGSGVAHQGVKIDPNGAYIVRAKARFVGKAGGSLGVQWRNEQGRWHNHAMALAAPFSKDLGNGWKEATVVIRSIPAGSHYLSAMLNSSGGKGDAVYFDDVEIFSMFEKNPPVAPHLKKEMEKWQKARALHLKGEALKNSKKTPLAKGNKVTNGNFNLWGAVTAKQPLKNAVTFKGRFTSHPAGRSKVKPEAYNAVGKGIGYSDDTAGVVTNGNGLILMTVGKIKPGEKYRISVKAKAIGKAKSSMKIYWSSRRVKGPFDYKLGMPAIPQVKKLENGWVLLEKVITVPAPAHSMSFIMTATGVKGTSDIVFFDEASAVLVP